MSEYVDKSELGLKSIHCEVLEGMIYINFAHDPAPFAPIREAMTECLRPYRLDKAKVAHRKSYPINANWKLSVENYTECYHCAPSHPEYSRGYSLAKSGGRSSEAMAVGTSPQRQTSALTSAGLIRCSQSQSASDNPSAHLSVGKGQPYGGRGGGLCQRHSL